jgi:hypothetical protein
MFITIARFHYLFGKLTLCKKILSLEKIPLLTLFDQR